MIIERIEVILKSGEVRVVDFAVEDDKTVDLATLLKGPEDGSGIIQNGPICFKSEEIAFVNRLTRTQVEDSTPDGGEEEAAPDSPAIEEA
jgi:hypothetical protein